MALGYMFYLRGYKNAANQQTGYLYIILSSEPVEESVVAAAWSYAIMNTYKGLEQADHEAALKLMLERHPSWRKVEHPARQIQFKMDTADQDSPEN